MYDDCGEARNATALATSTGSPKRPSGSFLRYSGPSTGWSITHSEMRVRTTPGATALTRMPSGARSSAAVRTSATTPPLEAL